MKLNSFLKTECRGSLLTMVLVLVRALYYKLVYAKSLVPHPRAIINGVGNIDVKGVLKIGLLTTGFVHRRDTTFLNIRGKLILKESYSIGRGCRIDIGKGAVVTVHGEGFINAHTNLIIAHSLSIGKDCSVSWGCQFLDEDFHEIQYAGKAEKQKGIQLGDRVWVGCGVYLYGGTVIPEGCVVSANSVVKGVFTQKNCLLAGNPARVVKENIHWNP